MNKHPHISYFAGAIDAKGFINVVQTHGYCHIRISMAITWIKQDYLEMFRTQFGGKVYFTKKRGLVWMLAKQEEVEATLRQLQPFVQNKAEVIEKALEVIAYNKLLKKYWGEEKPAEIIQGRNEIARQLKELVTSKKREQPAAVPSLEYKDNPI